jgi:hypothetical protein
LEFFVSQVHSLTLSQFIVLFSYLINEKFEFNEHINADCQLWSMLTWYLPETPKPGISYSLVINTHEVSRFCYNCDGLVLTANRASIANPNLVTETTPETTYHVKTTPDISRKFLCYIEIALRDLPFRHLGEYLADFNSVDTEICDIMNGNTQIERLEEKLAKLKLAI